MGNLFLLNTSTNLYRAIASQYQSVKCHSRWQNRIYLNLTDYLIVPKVRTKSNWAKNEPPKFQICNEGNYSVVYKYQYFFIIADNNEGFEEILSYGK